MRTKQKHSKIMISLDNDVFHADEAAELLGISLAVLLERTNRLGQYTTDDGIIVKRVNPVKPRKGTKIKRAMDGRIWLSIKAVAKELGRKANELEQEIRTNQMFTHDGHTYFAPDYKEVHKMSSAERIRYGNLNACTDEPAESLEQQPLTDKEIIETLDYEVNKTIQQLTTEERCEALLQELIVERARNKDYKGAAQALKAIQVLTTKDKEVVYE